MRCRSAMRRLRIRARGTSKHYLGGRGYFMPLALCISDRKRDLMNSSPSFLLVAISAAFSPVRPQQNEVYLRFSPRRSAKRASPLCSRWQRRFASSPRGPVGCFAGVLSALFRPPPAQGSRSLLSSKPNFRVPSGTRAPRLKREILRFNDELKRKNFPQARGQRLFSRPNGQCRVPEGTASAA